MIRKRAASRHITQKTQSGSGSGFISKPQIIHTNTRGGDEFKTTKRDKRIIKHSSFVSRIEKTNTKTKKRRRPSKKLVANLESLVDALPEDGGRSEELESDNVKMRHKSLKSRPGATKRKEKLEAMEKERFGKNMAQMVVRTATTSTTGAEGAGEGTAEKSGSSTTRWAALRAFIQQTMEQKPEFQGRQRS